MATEEAADQPGKFGTLGIEQKCKSICYFGVYFCLPVYIYIGS